MSVPKCPVTVPTYCNRDRSNKNVWLEGADPITGVGGVCLIDNLSAEQVIYIVERDEKARQDLIRITDDPELLALARNTPPLPDDEENDRLMKLLNANTLPFYTVFRGQPPHNG